LFELKRVLASLVPLVEELMIPSVAIEIQRFASLVPFLGFTD
jgi:hypothetical protein